MASGGIARMPHYACWRSPVRLPARLTELEADSREQRIIVLWRHYTETDAQAKARWRIQDHRAHAERWSSERGDRLLADQPCFPAPCSVTRVRESFPRPAPQIDSYATPPPPPH